MISRLRTIGNRSLAGVMAVWLSGIVLLFCCDEMSGRSMKADSCPLRKLSEHCDRAEREKVTEVVANPTYDQGMQCCAFIPALFDKQRTTERNKQLAAVTPALSIERPRLVAVTTYFAPANTYRSAALPRNDTFLKNRTFRI